ncbi:MAG TPA: hypothetical protein VF162_10550 [Streptosporangiaceae bacterium]
MTEATLEQNLTAARHEHLVPGREIHTQGMRGYRFCEVGLITGTSEDNAVANIWNTTGACDPTPEQFGTLDAGAIARDNGAARAWLGPLGRWMFDSLDVRQAGDDRTFGSITGTWMGVAGASTVTQAGDSDTYSPAYIYRDNSAIYAGGSKVYLLDAPDGEVFVMQSFAGRWDPARSDDNLAHLSGRLDLPPGWGFRTEILDQDMEVTSNPDNLAHVLQDNLRNVYQGSDAGRAFSQLCRDFERW